MAEVETLPFRTLADAESELRSQVASGKKDKSGPLHDLYVWVCGARPGNAVDGLLSPYAPLLDVSDHQHSALEVALLYAAWTQAALPQDPSRLQLSPHSRAGYQLFVDESRGKVAVYPSFAAELSRLVASHEADWTQASVCRDLWSVDLKVYQAIQAGDLKQVILAWLDSPGRRVLHDLAALTTLQSMPWAQLVEAAGWDDVPTLSESLVNWEALSDWIRGKPPRWRELHSAIPGYLMDHVLGSTGTDTDSKTPHQQRWIEQTVDGIPALMRWAAMVHLLDSAQSEPLYLLDGMRRNLKEDLGLHLAVALRSGQINNRDTLRELQRDTLVLVGNIMPRPTNEVGLLQAWGVSNWLQRCLFRSPWWGEDLESLGARLRAVTPEGSGVTITDLDPFHPLNFNKDHMNVMEVGFLGGLVAHYLGDPSKALSLPMPLPVLNELRRIAGRRELPVEGELELTAQKLRTKRKAQTSLNETAGYLSCLRWRGDHISPPRMARSLLTRFDLTWMAKANDEVLHECINQFVHMPYPHLWLVNALWTEREFFWKGRSPVTLLTEFWRGDGQMAPPPEATDVNMWIGAMGTLAALLLPSLANDEILAFVDRPGLVTQLEFNEYYKALEHLLDSAEFHRNFELWYPLMTLSLRSLDDTASQQTNRLELARQLLLRVPASQAPEKHVVLRELAAHLRVPPYSQRPQIVRELVRLGIP